MKTCAIICELNPAHNGHKYIFDKARELTEADILIAVMSGDFVQRGECALFDKHRRAQMALLLGADICIELPGIFATGSAEYFARGAVAILKALGNVDYLVFGSECGNIDNIKEVEPGSPNDILAKEYLRALEYFNMGTIPVPVKREGPGINDIKPSGKYAGATYIRNCLINGSPVNSFMPQDILEICETSRQTRINDFSEILLYKLINEDSFDSYFDIFPDLSNKIRKSIPDFTSLTDFYSKLKSKDIAHSHIRRALLHIILDYRKADFEKIKDSYLPYIRLLAFNANSRSYLGKLGNHPLFINKLSEASSILPGDNYLLFEKDIKASHLYSYISTGKVISEYRRKIITLQ